MRLGFVAVLAALLVAATPGAHAAPGAPDLAAQLTASRNISLMRDRRLIDDVQLAVLGRYEARIASLNSRIAKLETSNAASGRERDRAYAERDAARGDFIDYARKVSLERGLEQAASAAFEAEMRETVAAASPAKRSALQRFADGDRKGARPILDDLLAAEDQARERASRFRSATAHREHARLYDQMLIQGEVSTAQTAAVWEQVVLRDSGGWRDWWRVADLRMRLGDYEGAVAAYEQVYDASETPDQKVGVLAMLMELESGRRDGGAPTTRDQALNVRLANLLGIDPEPLKADHRSKLEQAKSELAFLNNLLGGGPDPTVSPTDAVWVIAARSCVLEADVLRQERRFDEAQARLAQCRKDLETRIKPNHSRRTYLEVAWKLERAAGDCAEDQKMYAAELPHRQAAARHGQEFWDADRSDRSPLHQLGWTYSALAWAQMNTKHDRLALNPFARSVEIFLLDLRTDPYSVYKVGSLRDVQLSQLLLYQKLKDFDGAAAQLDATEAALRDIVANRPDAAGALAHAFGAVEMRRAELALVRKDYPDALARLNAMQATLHPAQAGAPKSRDDSHLAIIELLRGRVAFETGDQAGAKDHYLKAFDLTQAIVSQPSSDEGLSGPSRDDERVLITAVIEVALIEAREDTWIWAIGWIDRAEKGQVINPEDYSPELTAALARERRKASNTPKS